MYIQDDAKVKEYRDIAMIVGIVIPIGLSNYLLSKVIVCVVLFILYKKQLICAKNRSEKVMDLSMNEINGIKQKDSELKETYRGDNLGESVIEIGLMPKDSELKETYRGDNLGLMPKTYEVKIS